MKHIQPGQKVPLNLTQAERSLVLEGLTCLPTEYERALRIAPAAEPVLLTLDDLDDLGGYVAAEANHTADKKVQKRLDGIFQKIQDLLDKYTDEEPSRTLKIEDAKKAKLIADQAVQLAEWTATALVAAEQLRIKSKPIEQFPLQEGQRVVLALLPAVPAKLQKKLVRQGADFTVADVASMMMAVAESLPEAEPMQQAALLMVAKSLMDCLVEQIARPDKPSQTRPKASQSLLQFKITLAGIRPPIWRRIQVRDCTLADLHEVVQVVMGWENCHLHQFIIDGVRYGPPDPEDFDFELEMEDENNVQLNQVVPKSGKKVPFKYKYDFGDGWEHEVLFEGFPPPAKNARYPCCLEGARSCPPEDVGGPWGYAGFLEAIADVSHERHEELLEWIGGGFDPERFLVDVVNKELR